MSVNVKSDLLNVPWNLRPFMELVIRLRRLCDPQTGTLKPLRFDETQLPRNDKHDNLPYCRIVEFTGSESHGRGAPMKRGPEYKPGINSIVRPTQEAVLQVVTDRDNGWATDDSVVTDIRKKGLLNIATLLMDGIETDHNGLADASLSLTMDMPVMFSMRDSGLYNLGFIMDISITLSPLRMERTTRSCTVVQ